MNLASLLERAARQHPGRPALLLGSELLYSYAELADRVARLARALREFYGLAPGDRVVLFMSNEPAYLELLYACWWAGLAVVPVNAKLHPQELAYIVEDSGARLACVSSAFRDAVRRELPELRLLVPNSTCYAEALLQQPLPMESVEAGDLAWLFYTSGTTGRPKGVIETHAMLLAMTACYFSDVDPSLGIDDAIVYAAPMSHGAGLYNFAFVARAARHVVPVSEGFEPAELAGLAESVGRLCLFAAPTMVRRLVDELERLGRGGEGFKTLVYGGGPMYVEDIQRALRVMGPRFVQIYGQGESPMTITALAREDLADVLHPDWLSRIASVGRAQLLVEVRVADEQGQALPDGAVGEVLVRGATVMPGYWNKPEASSAALRDGWLWTGDLGVLDAHGYLTLKDRSKDLIISGGSNIYPREVEEVLLAAPGVREVAVVGQSDREWGEVVVAFVVADAGVDAAALDALCLERIARFKRPKRYEFVAALPKNHYGKVLKTALREPLNPKET
ncbi:AMP-binding protein [Pelomonas sp. SE-A7]|uniref:class I adenylate-forming enzyme family protein n=1 Tax=Pelomonas sp. SE-A7 TaxID=3054953 RepID=UPI00259CC196|nr:AMP-binding protein [Pelomonas sp. SE-A7]MDM4766613.1 AMP-binding protein [Pelomonas sp. SE-A7]